MYAFKFTTLPEWFQRLVRPQIAADPSASSLLLSPLRPLPHPTLSQLARTPHEFLPTWVRRCPVALDYLTLLGDLDWDHFPARAANRAWPGPQPAPRAPFVAAYLVKINENLKYMSTLHTFLCRHPALAWVLGFDLIPSESDPCGFDMAASLPDRKQFGRILRELPNPVMRFLLNGTVDLIQAELPPGVRLGEDIALDTKHILAWVKENNPKEFVKDRYDKTQQPKGDPDCKLGCKKKSNQAKEAPASEPATALPPSTPPTPTTDPIPGSQKVGSGQYYWGYASGVVVSTVEGAGDVVLAELTQPFDRSDPSYFFPLMAQTEQCLGFRPKNGALDAAFDAFYVYEYFYKAGGMAAVPYADRESHRKQFDPEGLPLCAAGLAMPRERTFEKRSNCLIPHECGVYQCPLHFPAKVTQVCPIQHKNWEKGGCQTVLPTSIGNRIHHELDRESADYLRLYRLRPGAERINSQAVELGIERPKLRNQASITNQDTLIYVLINLKALQRLRTAKAKTAQTQGG